MANAPEASGGRQWPLDSLIGCKVFAISSREAGEAVGRPSRTEGKKAGTVRAERVFWDAHIMFRIFPAVMWLLLVSSFFREMPCILLTSCKNAA